MSVIKDLGLTTKPRHSHNCCGACIFLGHHGEHDLYVCLREDTVIARYGALGDYYSGSCFSYGAIEPLTEARRRAQERGVLKYNLREGVRHTREDDPKSVEELRTAIIASPEGRALMLASGGRQADREEGVRQLGALMESAALNWQAQFPDKELPELRGWYSEFVAHLHRWMLALALPADLGATGKDRHVSELVLAGMLQ